MKFDVLARFRETILTVKSVSSSEIFKINFGFFLSKLRFCHFSRNWKFLGSYRNSSYLVYFPSLGRKKWVFRLRVILAKKKNWIFGFCLMFIRLSEPQFAKAKESLKENWFFA